MEPKLEMTSHNNESTHSLPTLALTCRHSARRSQPSVLSVTPAAAATSASACDANCCCCCCCCFAPSGSVCPQLFSLPPAAPLFKRLLNAARRGDSAWRAAASAGTILGKASCVRCTVWGRGCKALTAATLAATTRAPAAIVRFHAAAAARSSGRAAPAHPRSSSAQTQ